MEKIPTRIVQNKKNKNIIEEKERLQQLQGKAARDIYGKVQLCFPTWTTVFGGNRS
jgi:hypothetical protein